jgi:hypothetical protein
MSNKIFIDRQQEMNTWLSNYFSLPVVTSNSEDSFFNLAVQEKLDSLDSSKVILLQKEFYFSTLFLTFRELMFLYKDQIHLQKPSQKLMQDRLKKLVYNFESHGFIYFLNSKYLFDIYKENFNLPSVASPRRPKYVSVLEMARILGFHLLDPLKLDKIATLRLIPLSTEEVNISIDRVVQIHRVSLFANSYDNLQTFENIIHTSQLGKEKYVTLEEKIKQITKRKKNIDVGKLLNASIAFMELLDYPCYSIDGILKYLDTQELYEVLSTFLLKYKTPNV